MADARLPGKSGGWPDVLLTLCGLLLACSVHGALPGWMVPVQWQMVWSGGFAESLAHQGWFSLYADNFGAPARAPISFGLSGVWPMAVLIRLGLALQDAYALTVAIWLAVAFAGAAALALRLGAHRRVSLMLATCWLTLPMVWGHAWYSMLALGIALLPTYLLVTLGLLQSQRGSPTLKLACATLTPAVACVAVFMDGYTFVMYGVGALLLIVSEGVMVRGRRAHALGALGVQVLALALAYQAYRRYVGALPLDPTQLDMFRGMALDLHYLVVPTLQASPFWDAIGWSSARSALDQFGDASVWTTTFALPLLVLGVLAWRGVSGWSGMRVAVSGLIIVAFYLSLGPSLKVLSSTAFPLHAVDAGQMPADAGLFSTGNAWVFQSVPGISSMRASYRWLALALCGIWMLVAIWMGQRWRGRQVVPLAMLSAVVLLQLPDLPKQWSSKHTLREMFLSMDQAVARDVALLHLQDETVVFLPTGNDFLVNHIAARHRMRTFNVGGDKNVDLARRGWPASVRGARAQPGADMGLEVRNILLKGDADAVVLPHFSLQDASHEWPCQALSPLNAIGPWAKPGDAVGAQSLQLVIPISASHTEHAVYLRRSRAATGDAWPTLSLRSGPAGAVLQQRMSNGGWTSAAAVRVTAAPDARLLLPTPDACRTSTTCDLTVSMDWGASVSVKPGDLVATNVGPGCPGPMRESLAPLLHELRKEPWFEVQETEFFSVVRPAPSLRSAGLSVRQAVLADSLGLPLRTNSTDPRLGTVLVDGWYDPEPTHVWSQAQASMSIPVPRRCLAAACEIHLDFFALGASPAHPVSVTATHLRTGKAVTWELRSDRRFLGRLPVEAGVGLEDIRLSVAQATSPRLLGLSDDDRVLGIRLESIDVRPLQTP